MRKIALYLFIFTYSYAFIRYHFGKNVPFEEWLYVLNKAFSWTAFTLIGLSILPQSWFDKRKLLRKETGIIGYLLGMMHLILIFCLINEQRYPFLYLSPEEWSWKGIVTLALGSIAFCCFTIAFLVSTKLIKTRELRHKSLLKFGKIGFFVAIMHPFAMSYQNWFSGKWPYYFPPITLIAVLCGLIFFFIRWRIKRGEN